MKKNILLFIIGLSIFSNILALELNLTASEKSVFADNENIRVTQWNKIQSINTKLETLNSKILGISFLSNVADPNSKLYMFQKAPLGLSNDPVRVKINLTKAQEHMYLGDYLTANEIVEKELKNIDSRNRGTISWAYKILFQANRMLKDHTKTTQVCLKMLYIGGDEEYLFPDLWRLACSNEFVKESMQIKKKNNYEQVKQNLIIWSNSPIVKNDSKYMVLSASYISLSYRYIFSDNSFSINYLQEAISHTKSGNYLIARSYLVLALLKYEFGKREEALSLIRYLSDDFKGYGENLKYFEKDETARVLARLCLARFHASMYNLKASETWYQDVLNEENVSKFELDENEKLKAQMEFSHILFLQKKYKESAISYRKTIEKTSSSFNNLFSDVPLERGNKIRISRFLLAKILSKSEVKNKDSKLLLLDLYGETTADLQFLKKLKENSIKDKSEQIENILALASLAEEYGLESNKVTVALNFRNAYYNLENELRVIRSDLANSIYVNDLSYSGILETRAVSSLYKIDNILNAYKDIALELDSLEYQLWDTEKAGSKFAKDHRYELLKRLTAMDDEVSKYKLNQEIEDKIFKPKFPLSLKNLSRNIDNLNAEISSLNFLFALNNNKVPVKAENDGLELLENTYTRFSIDKMYDDLAKSTIEERIFQISRGLKSKSSILFEKKYVAIGDTLKSLHTLHLKNKEKPYSIGDNEIAEAIKISWSNLFSSLKQLDLSLSLVKDRIVNERKEILEKINEVNNHITKTENSILALNKMILNEYNEIVSEIVMHLFPRVKKFEDYINISLAEYAHENSKLANESDEVIKQAAEQRENWIKSLRKSAEMDLMR